jgi:hypothetical protein
MPRKKKVPLPSIELGLEAPDELAPSSPLPQRSGPHISHTNTPALEYPDPEPEAESQPILQVDSLERLTWSAEMTEALVECIYAVFKAGKAADNGFKKESWIDALEAVMRVY